MPGKKDCLSVKKEKGRVNIQKRLVLRNCILHLKISILKQVQPRHCVLAAASGTHCVCVCTIHQNLKLMVHAIKLDELTSSDGIIVPYI